MAAGSWSAATFVNDEARRLTERDVVKDIEAAAPKPPSADELKLYYLDELFAWLENRARNYNEPAQRGRALEQATEERQPTLEELLPHVIGKIDPKLKKRKGIPPPVRPVHRLDRETTGLMVFARTAAAESNLCTTVPRAFDQTTLCCWSRTER